MGWFKMAGLWFILSLGLPLRRLLTLKAFVQVLMPPSPESA